MISTAVNNDKTPHPNSSSQNASAVPGKSDDLIKAFNTALITSQPSTSNQLGDELEQLMQDPAYRQIIEAVSRLAESQGVDHLQAAEKLICSFRKADRIWSNYVFLQGLQQIQRQ